MTLGYRSILRLDDSENAVKVATEQVRSWLKSKHRDQRGYGTLDAYEWDGPGTHVMGPNAKLTAVEHSGEDASRRLLLRLEEENNSGTWCVSVTATSLPNGANAKQLIVVEVDADAEIANGRPVSENTKPPTIIRSLLDVTKARDFHADIPLTASPTVVDVDDVESLAVALLDTRRTTSIVVGGAIPGAPLAPWSKIIGNLVWNSAGTTAAFVLTEAAQEQLNIRLTATHAVGNGAVRTFLPGVEPADKADALRHRILYPGSLADSLTNGMRVRPSLVRVHAASARRQLLERPLPHEALRSARILEREELRASGSATTSRPSSPPVPSYTTHPTTSEAQKPSQDQALKNSVDGRPTNQQPVSTEENRVSNEVLEGLLQLFGTHTGSEELSLENIQMLDQTLSKADSAVKTHSDRIDALLDNINKVRDERDALKQEYENAEYELALEAEERRREAEHRRHLARLAEFQSNKLKSLQDFDIFEDPDEGLDESPKSVIDMLARLESEERVAKFIDFTGDLDKAMDLEIYDGLGRCAATFWEYILIMRDYCLEKAERNFTGNLFGYLTSDQTHGRKCDPKRYSPTESTSVKSNSKWRKERLLPVPGIVEPSKQVLMLAHFKTTFKDGVAPRMHIHDDTANTGKIYIGYIGKHLSNTMTN